MKSRFPLFRYHPFPVYTGAIEARAITCPVCGLASDYSYAFTLDADGALDEREARVCPWCLHDGSAARRFPSMVGIDPPAAPDVDAAARDELAHRTPAIATFQEHEWPVHHGDYAAFIGYVGWKEIAPYARELAADLTRLRRALGWRKQEMESW